MTCDGCGQGEATRTLWLAAPLGLTTCHVHDRLECAEAARKAKGGGKWTERPRTKEERLGLIPALSSAAQRNPDRKERTT